MNPAHPSPDDVISQRLLTLLAEIDTKAAFLDQAMAMIQQQAQAASVWLYRPLDGLWRRVATSGGGEPPPMRMLAETADREARLEQADWTIVPLSGVDGYLLALRQAKLAPRHLASLQVSLAAAVQTAERRERMQLRDRWGQLLAGLSTDSTAAARQLERAAAELLGAEHLVLAFPDARGLLHRPHATEGRADPFSLPTAVLPGRGESARFTDSQQVKALQATGEQLGIAVRSLLIHSLTGANGQPALLVLINPAQHADPPVMERAAEFSAWVSRLLTFSPPGRSGLAPTQLVAHSPSMRQLVEQIERIAPTDLSVLILGENGTGKERVSQAIHQLSDRRDRPLLVVNCAALTETLLETELFGHEKGAFTDAHDSKPGKFEQAHEGTLFLDEIGELSLAAQAKLLRVIEQQVIVRVGGTQPIATDVRVIAATHRDLAAMVRADRFREDLFYRLNVVLLQVPPLRNRRQDIPVLAAAFLAEFSQQAGRRPPVRLSRPAEERLSNWSWPGNVRELRNLIERLVFLTDGDVVEVDQVEAELQTISTQPPRHGGGLNEATQQFQIEHITQTIDACGGSMTEAAKVLGLHRSNLYRKMRQLGMDRE